MLFRSWMASSASYWIASAADILVAPDTGIVGSMGTVLTKIGRASCRERGELMEVAVLIKKKDEIAAKVRTTRVTCSVIQDWREVNVYRHVLKTRKSINM